MSQSPSSQAALRCLCDVQVVGLARSDVLNHTLIDYLMGETDGIPKDPNYIFKLYLALGNYVQAASTALIIAKQEQEMGNYKVAHNILLQTHRDLEAHSVRIPQDLHRSLLLLHSYIIVKKLVKLGDHTAAARMLVRVAKNISKFPSHVVPILSSTGASRLHCMRCFIFCLRIVGIS